MVIGGVAGIILFMLWMIFMLDFENIDEYPVLWWISIIIFSSTIIGFISYAFYVNQ